MDDLIYWYAVRRGGGSSHPAVPGSNLLTAGKINQTNLSVRVGRSKHLKKYAVRFVLVQGGLWNDVKSGSS